MKIQRALFFCVIVYLSQRKVAETSQTKETQGRVFQPVDKNEIIIGGDCSKEEIGAEKYWDEGVEINRCANTAPAIMRFTKPGDGRIYGCVQEFLCGDKFNNGTGHCTLTLQDCYHQKGCIVPKDRLLPQGNCKDENWELNKPDFCSIISSGPGCELVGHVSRLPWIIDSAGVKRFLNKLTIEYAQTKSMEDSYWEDKRYTTSGPVTGTDLYCSRNHLGPSCIVRGSNGINPYRIFKIDSETPMAHIGTCKTPIYCFGYEEILVFGKAQNKTIRDCANCHITCDEKEVSLVIPDATAKTLRICGRQSCQILNTMDKLISIKRNFHQRITDERVTVEVSDSLKTFSYQLIATCPLVEICEALDCNFCKARLLNPSCYMWYHWIITLIILYAALVGLGMLIIATSPIMNISIGLIKLVYKLTKKLTMICVGRTKSGYNSVNQYVDVEVDLAHTTYKPTTVRGQPQNAKKLLMFIVMILNYPQSGLTKAPCSAVVVDNVPTQVCSKVGSQYQCQIGSLVEVPMISYDQTSCLHFLSPSGSTIGELQITPLDLSFKCQKELLYFTRDVEYRVDHVTRCPHAGDCSEEWCAKVDKNTNVEGMSEAKGLREQFCKLGAACAGAGCFYCTSSCHTIKYYPRPKDAQLYEVFYCPKWEPSGVFHFEWEGTKATQITKLNLIHGQTASISPEIKVTLQMTVQTKLPILSKNFLKRGDMLAVLHAAAVNQPQPGIVGHLQCPTAKDALEMSEHCIMAPNVCICSPTGESDQCDCSQIDLVSAFHSETQLPITLGGDYLTEIRGIPSLKSSAYGSAFIRVHTTGTLVGDYIEEEECKVKFSTLSGCHSCVIGANLTYKCDTAHPTTIVSQCSTGLNLVMQCDNTGVDRTTRVHVPSPMVDIGCRVACSKDELRLTGTLKSVGLHPINNGSHIQLSPADSMLDFTSWLKSIWGFFSWWYILLLITGIVIVMVFVLYGINKTRKFMDKKSR